MSNERYELNKNLAQMLKGGVIMDVTTPEQARIMRRYTDKVLISYDNDSAGQSAAKKAFHLLGEAGID